MYFIVEEVSQYGFRSFLYVVDTTDCAHKFSLFCIVDIHDFWIADCSLEKLWYFYNDFKFDEHSSSTKMIASLCEICVGVLDCIKKRESEDVNVFS